MRVFSDRLHSLSPSLVSVYPYPSIDTLSSYLRVMSNFQHAIPNALSRYDNITGYKSYGAWGVLI